MLLMAWPFAEYIRPLMRSVLFWMERGETDEQISERLSGPPHSHPQSWIDQAMPEARRSLQFSQLLSGDDESVSPAQLWAQHAESIWHEAYHRPPTEAEREWWLTQPSAVLGLRAVITVEGVENWRSTPTLNVPWDATIEDIKERLIDWFLSALSPSAGEGSVETAVNAGAAISVAFDFAGPMRVDPTLSLRAGG